MIDKRTEIILKYNRSKTIEKDDLTWLLQTAKYWEHKYNSEVETIRKRNQELKGLVKKYKKRYGDLI